MRCKEVQEYLLSDYTDQELKVDLQKTIQEHVSGCQICQEFEKALVEASVFPFDQVKPLQPAASVWDNIEHQIACEEVVRSKPRRASVLRPSFNWVAVAALLLFAMIPMRMNSNIKQEQVVQHYLYDQMLFLSDLITTDQDEMAGDDYLGWEV